MFASAASLLAFVPAYPAGGSSVLTFNVETDDNVVQIAVALRAARARGRDADIRSTAAPSAS